MLNWIKNNLGITIFYWKVIHLDVSNRYLENTLTKQRKVEHIEGCGYQPINNKWLDGNISNLELCKLTYDKKCPRCKHPNSPANYRYIDGQDNINLNEGLYDTCRKCK
jgi:hypothetical protein